MNLDGDSHLSLEHCVLEQDADGFSLTDLDSRNGTYVKIKADHAVDHGDYMIVGKEVLRVELNA
jgi:predicted component of type VI protein secretion system